MLLLNHKTRYADVRIRRDVVQMYFQCSKILLCSKGLVCFVVVGEVGP